MHAEKTSPRLSLASHVRACQSDGQVILLDLQHNRYLGIGQQMSNALTPHIAEWPISSQVAQAHASAASVADLVHSLKARGLLTEAPVKLIPSATAEEATASLDPEDPALEQSLNARRVSNFLKSAAVAAWWMHGRSLHGMALAVAARRERSGNSSAASLAAMKSAAAAYAKLRPLVVTARERCLQDSLALLGFLATEGLHPQWIVGVKTGPFGAHSWIQYGNTVLNDQHEYVRRFCPILVV